MALLPLNMLASPRVEARMPEGQTWTAGGSGAEPTRQGWRQCSRKTVPVSGWGGRTGEEVLVIAAGWDRALETGRRTQGARPGCGHRTVTLQPDRVEGPRQLGQHRALGSAGAGLGLVRDCLHPLGAEPGSTAHPIRPQGLVGREEWPQEMVVQLLASPGNEAVAAQCALGLSVPEEQLPATVAAELRRLELQER